MTAIQEIREDMNTETGDDSLFLRIFRKHRGIRVTGIDREVRLVERKQMRKEYEELTTGGDGEAGLPSAIAIEIIAKRYGACKSLVYETIHG